ncbi:uncharacterized protein LOC122042739 [Zingiber officinale]|uniref:uncharacterized protein LOC122042739 n=1 Tax=Zingiber officinale TaxID=94328 RepID=UPI001C4DA748|nr:uncharacterized protein LOC122042739 [Zingiber officinale]
MDPVERSMIYCWAIDSSAEKLFGSATDRSELPSLPSDFHSFVKCSHWITSKCIDQSVSFGIICGRTGPDRLAPQQPTITVFSQDQANSFSFILSLLNLINWHLILPSWLKATLS